MRPFYIVSISAILGIITGLYLKSIALLLCVLMILVCIFLKLKKMLDKYVIIGCICFTLFCFYTLLLERNYKQVWKKYDKQTITIQGVVVSNGNQKKYKTAYEIQVWKIYNDKGFKKEKFKVLCDIKGEKDDIGLELGDEIIFSSKFEAPYTARNEGCFDYSQYLKTKKIAGSVMAQKENIKVVGKNKGNMFYKIITNLRNILIEKTYKILPKNEGGLCIGLLLGEKSGISSNVENSFRQASLSHMLAISGAHISYILLGISTALTFLKIHKKITKIFIIFFLLIFMFLAGGSPSIARACIMAILNLIAEVIFRKADTFNNLGISTFIILLFNPYALLDISFQLSFGGTIGIVTFVELLYNIRLKKKGITKKKDMKVQESVTKKQEKKYSVFIYKILIYVEQTMIMSLAANIVITPIMLYNFSSLSLVFIISNLLATPIMGICLILGMIFMVSLIISPFAYVISIFLKPLLKIFILIAELSSKMPFSKVLMPTPKIWQIIIYYFIIIIYFFKDKLQIIYPHMLKNYKKLIAFCVILVIIPYLLTFIPTNKTEIYFIDVGQGDSMLIVTPSKKKVLIDGGGSEFGSFDVGEQTLLPYLLNKSILSIDYILFTHFDSDHCQGLLTVLENIKVKNVIIGEQGKESENFEKFSKLVKLKKVNVITVKAGDRLKIDKDCSFEVLYPETDLIKQNILNNNSIVTKFWYKEYSILLTGDIEKIAEERLIRKYKDTNKLQANILKVAHHGSKSSSIQQFLDEVKPEIALIGVGEKNTFGHPNDGVIERLENLRL